MSTIEKPHNKLSKKTFLSGDLKSSKLKTTLVIYKNRGKFYNSKGVDAFILNILFGYKVLNGKCGFPDNIIEKILNKLETEKISYQIIYCDRDMISKKYKFNKYLKFYNEAIKKMNITEKICLLENKINEASLEDLESLLNIINENL